MTFRRIAISGILLAVLGAAVFGWFRFVAHPRPAACGYCARPLHANLRVTAEIAGRRREVCCARCAVTEANQEHKPLRLIEVHDYATGKAIPPGGAWFVEGSRAMACGHDAMRMNEMKRTEEVAFDRCSPGTFAFAQKQDADDFTAQHGGTVVSYAQLMGEARFQ